MTLLHRPFRALLATVAVTVGLIVAPLVPAQASGGASVSTTPAAFTPYLLSADSQITQLVQCRTIMFAVGSFTQIASANGAPLTRANAFSFHSDTGAVTSWNPDVNGTVSAIAVNPTCSVAYLAGTFTKIGSTAVTNLAEVSTTTGLVTTAFRPQPNDAALTLALHGSQLLVGGQFTSIGGASRTALASVSPTTGAATSYLTLPVRGTIAGNSGKTRIAKLRVSPNGTRAMALGNFSTVGSQVRSQAFMIGLGLSATVLGAWYAPALNKACATSLPYYIRSVAWSPDNNRVYLGATGDAGASILCDSASAFSSVSNPNLAPIWVNKTGCDSIFSIAADSTTVYVGGHERWADNAYGCDNAGSGSVPRPGVGGLSVTNGTALAWNPTRDRDSAPTTNCARPTGSGSHPTTSTTPPSAPASTTRGSASSRTADAASSRPRDASHRNVRAVAGVTQVVGCTRPAPSRADSAPPAFGP